MTHLKVKLSPEQLRAVYDDHYDDWIIVGENTDPGFVYWNQRTGEILQNPESKNPVLLRANPA